MESKRFFVAQMSMRRGQQKKLDIEKQVVWKPRFL